MAKTLAASALVSPGTTKAAATVTRARIDVSDKDGGMLTAAVVNGATGPTEQVVVNVLIAHGFGAMPTEGSDGASDWKKVQSIGCGLVGNLRTVINFAFGPEVAYIEIEFSTHTGPNVSIESFITTYKY